MEDLLYVSFDKNEKKFETGLCVGRPNKDGSHTILKMVLDDEAEQLYKVLTEQKTKVIVIEEGATNGEVAMQLFRDKGESIKVCTYNDKLIGVKLIKDWWNAPYKEGEKNE